MRVVVFDTETDALVSNTAKRLDLQPSIIELFALALEQSGEGEEATFEEVGTFQSFFDIGKPISEEAVKITGITDEMVKGAPKWKMKADEISAFFGQAGRTVAHNASYDMTVMNFEMVRAGLEPFQFNGPLCTVEATEFFKGFRLNLNSLHEELFGEGFEGAHRAETDVRATTRCYMELVRRGVI